MDHLKTWLDREPLPRTFYELLGVPCLSDRRDEMLSIAKSATRFLHQYQHHNGKRIVERARQLQLMCARAAYTFSVDAAWQAYDREVLQRIREECLAMFSAENIHRRRADVRIWLRDVQHIAGNRIDEVLSFVSSTNKSAETKVIARPVSSTSVAIPIAQKPAPPPIPARSRTGQMSTISAGTPPQQPIAEMPQTASSHSIEATAAPSELAQTSTAVDRTIWRLTGFILLLTLLGALWLLARK